MAFFASLFSCCNGGGSGPRSNTNKSEGPGEEWRNVRVRNVRRSDDGSWGGIGMRSEGASPPPPRYEDVCDGGRGEVPVVVWDEKDSGVYDAVLPVAEGEEEPRRQEHRSTVEVEGRRSVTPTMNMYDGDMDGDDDSSVVSVPSTRLSGLASSYTGTTNRTNMRSGENRFSFAGSRVSDMEFGDGSAPPSYYAGSVVGEVDVEAERGEGHPVLSEGWLERLRVHAERNMREGNQI